MTLPWSATFQVSLPTTEPDDTSIVVRREFGAPAAKVWQAMTEPDHLRRWLGNPGFPLTTCEMDVRVGGRDRLLGKFVDGSESRFEAQYFDVVPEKRLVYAYDMYWQERKISVSLASVEFVLAGKGTRLVLTEQHAFLDGYEDAGSRERGTRNLMDNLQVALGGGDTRVPGK